MGNVRSCVSTRFLLFFKRKLVDWSFVDFLSFAIFLVFFSRINLLVLLGLGGDDLLGLVSLKHSNSLIHLEEQQSTTCNALNE